MTTDVDAVQRIKERIDEICRARLAEKPAILLSELGTALGADLSELKQHTGKRLTEFIEEQFSGIYRVTRIPDRGNAIIVVPAAFTEEQVADLLLEDIKPRRDPKDYIPRFRPVFWTAFAKPIQEGRRFLCTEPLDFKDGLGGSPTGDGWIEVPSDAIPPANLPERDSAIYESIKHWLENNELDADRFLFQSGSNSQTKRVSLLQAVISSLDIEQQRQIHLSLDVIRKLLARSVNL